MLAVSLDLADPATNVGVRKLIGRDLGEGVGGVGVGAGVGAGDLKPVIRKNSRKGHRNEDEGTYSRAESEFPTLSKLGVLITGLRSRTERSE